MISRELQIELHIYNLGVEKARRAYELDQMFAANDAATERRREVRRAKADLLVATSVEECAQLLAVLDRIPSVPSAICGTDSGYRSHRRRSEPACRPCRDAHTAYVRSRRSA